MKTLKTRPTEPLLALARVKDHLRLDADDVTFDDLLPAYMLAAEIDVEELTGFALAQQNWEATFADGGSLAQFVLEGGPGCAVTEIAILIAGVYVVQSTSTYAVRPVTRFATLVRPALNATWPAADRDEAAFRIRYTIGATSLPAPLEAALLLIISDLFNNRDAKTPVNLGDNPTVARLLAPYHAPSL